MKSVIFLTCNKLLHLESALSLCSLHNTPNTNSQGVWREKMGGSDTLTVGAPVSFVATSREVVLSLVVAVEDSQLCDFIRGKNMQDVDCPYLCFAVAELMSQRTTSW